MSRRGIFLTASIAVCGLAVLLTLSSASWERPVALFWIVLVAASLCVVAATCLVVLAHRNDQAELGLVAGAFLAASLLPLAHGILLPGVLYGSNSATATAVFLVAPIMLVANFPTIFRTNRLFVGINRRWRVWVGAVAIVVIVICAVLLQFPSISVMPTPGTAAAWIISPILYALLVALGLRHIYLAEIAERNGPALVGYGYLLVGASGLVFLDSAMWSPLFWFAHAIDIAGVFLATIGGLVAYRRTGVVSEVLAPVVAVHPHAALEVGLNPSVHEFIAQLEQKDALTRDHVIRTGALAIDVARELDLGPREVRQCGLVGLLHDIGKLGIPDEILTKPGRLTDDEYATIKNHTNLGDQILRSSPSLAPIAGDVRAHHERFDGTGYPDAKAGFDIPLNARIVAVCDAYDAMAVTRHYRDGMDCDEVVTILKRHSGSQWDPTAVDALLRVIDRSRDRVLKPTALVNVGTRIGCDCAPAGATATV